MTIEYKTAKENYEDTLAEARQMTKRELESVLTQRLAYHGWAVRAYEKALDEK